MSQMSHRVIKMLVHYISCLHFLKIKVKNFDFKISFFQENLLQLNHLNLLKNRLPPPFAGAALAPKMLAPEKSPGIKFCRQFQKVGASKFRCHNLFVQNRSLSSMQIVSLMTPTLKS